MQISPGSSAFVAALCLTLFAPPSGHAADYYEGKTVTYIVATAPGGGYDSYGRLVSEYMQRHLPGSLFVVKNMPGAGSIKATGYIYWGNESLLGDAFAGYRFRLPWVKIPATVQLNVKNVGNHYLANVGRYNDNYTGVRRVYLNEPRSFRLTTTLDF